MDTNVCFVFLLAIGLSTQRVVRRSTEFEIDFNSLVENVKLQDGIGTLLNCTENCDKVKETACKCVHFDHCLNSTILNCISTGLLMLNLAPSEEFERLLSRLEDFSSLRTTPADPQQWHTPVSPRRFLNYIQTQHQQLNAQRG